MAQLSKMWLTVGATVATTVIVSVFAAIVAFWNANSFSLFYLSPAIISKSSQIENPSQIQNPSLRKPNSQNISVPKKKDPFERCTFCAICEISVLLCFFSSVVY